MLDLTKACRTCLRENGGPMQSLREQGRIGNSIYYLSDLLSMITNIKVFEAFQSLAFETYYRIINPFTNLVHRLISVAYRIGYAKRV